MGGRMWKIAHKPEECFAEARQAAAEKSTLIVQELRELEDRLARLSPADRTAEEEKYREWRADRESKLSRWRDIQRKLAEDPAAFLGRRETYLAAKNVPETSVISEGERLLAQMDARRHAPGTSNPTSPTPAAPAADDMSGQLVGRSDDGSPSPRRGR